MANWLILADIGMDMDMQLSAWQDRCTVVMGWLQVWCQYLVNYGSSKELNLSKLSPYMF